jgi:hypothetical protein
VAPKPHCNRCEAMQYLIEAAQRGVFHKIGGKHLGACAPQRPASVPRESGVIGSRMAREPSTYQSARCMASQAAETTTDSAH